MLYSKDSFPTIVSAPDYQALADWWCAWPEARPEMLDFWARGGFMQRILWRRQQKRHGLIVRVSYVDELEFALRRLALLDLEVDFLWTGDTSAPALVLAPQDIDFEGVGGWGYITCAGDEFSERRIGREWCPTLAFANLLPDSVTDWLAEQAIDFCCQGRIVVCPIEAVGVPQFYDNTAEANLQELAASPSIIPVGETVQLLANLDLPVLEGMAIRDIYRFCEDYQDELARFRQAISQLLTTQSSNPQELVKEIADAISELRSSKKTQRMRSTLIAAGGVLASFELAVAVSAPTNPASLALTAGGAALAALTWWVERVASQKEARRNPFWIAWKLQRSKRQTPVFKTPRLVDDFGLLSQGRNMENAPRHWLAPPSGGWEIPTGFIPGGQIGA